MTDLLETVEEGIATLTLNRPAVMNAMGGTLRERFVEQVEALERDPEVWVVIITGEGPAFSAGGDLRAYLDLYRNPPAFRAFLDEFRAAEQE
jgi:enoyl-CoA hydratase/carnithine racemase